MQSLNEWIEENKKLCEKATPGPWKPRKKFKAFNHATATPVECYIPGRRGVAGASGGYLVAWLFDEALPGGARTAASNSQFVSKARLSLPQALRIINALLPMIHSDQVIIAAHAAEKIINEK